MKNAIIHYFSGTGNTAHAANVLGNTLIEKGWGVQYIRINSKNNSEKPADLHIFMYPVFALSFPYGFLKYMNKLKNGCNAKTAVIANHGMINLKGGINTGSEGNGPARAASILKKKKYDVFFTGAIGYPENITIISNAIPDNDIESINTAADMKIIKMTEDISEYKPALKKYDCIISLVSMLFGFIFKLAGRRHIGKFYSADKDCNKCGVCVRSCPAGVIRLVSNKPVWKWNCEACLACFNICPKKSINISIARIVAFGFVMIMPIIILFSSFERFYGSTIGLIINNGLTNNFAYVVTAIAFYCASYIAGSFIIDKIIFVMERIPFINKIFNFTYSKKIKRYKAPDYKFPG